MVNKVLFFILVIMLIPNWNFCQSTDLVELKTYQSYHVDFDSLNFFENQFYPSGEKRVEFDIKSETTAFRTEYWTNGLPRIESNVKILCFADTLIRGEIGKEEIYLDRHCHYVPNGEYIEYHQPTSIKDTSRIRAIGVFNKYGKAGIWEFYNRRDNNKTIINYSDTAQLEGDYKEFYYNPYSKNYTVKRTGQFAEIQYSDRITTKSGHTYAKKYTETRRVGEWKYYSREGILLEVINYEWLEK